MKRPNQKRVTFKRFRDIIISGQINKYIAEVNQFFTLQLLEQQQQPSISLSAAVSSPNNGSTSSLLLKYDINTGDYHGHTIMHLAAMRNDVASMRYILSKSHQPVDLNAQNYSMHTPLHLAASYGALEAVDLLMKCRVDVNILDDQNCTAQQKAMNLKKREVVELLEEYKMLRVRQQHYGLLSVEEFLSSAQQPSQSMQWYSMHNMEDEHLKLVKRYALLEQRDLGVIDQETGKNALHLCASVGNYHHMQVLISAAEKIYSNNNRTSPSKYLGNTSSENRCPCSFAYLTKSALFNSQDYGGNTALHYAIAAGSYPCTLLLLAAGASATLVNRSGHRPVQEFLPSKKYFTDNTHDHTMGGDNFSKAWGFDELQSFLEYYGLLSQSSSSSLALATSLSQSPKIPSLDEAYDEVTQYESRGQTKHPQGGGKEDSHRATTKAAGGGGTPPPPKTSTFQSPNSSHVLLHLDSTYIQQRRQSLPNATEFAKRSHISVDQFLTAAENGHVSLMKDYLKQTEEEKGGLPSPNSHHYPPNTAKDTNNGWTAMHYAAMWGQVEVIYYLQDIHADFGILTCPTQQTALHVAADYGKSHALRAILFGRNDSSSSSFLSSATLIDFAVDYRLLLLKDSNGRTARDIAEKRNFPNIVKFLDSVLENELPVLPLTVSFSAGSKKDAMGNVAPPRGNTSTTTSNNISLALPRRALLQQEPKRKDRDVNDVNIDDENTYSSEEESLLMQTLNEADDLADYMLCITCVEVEPDIRFPCGHCIMCTACIKKLKKYMCPMCRVPFSGKILQEGKK